MRVLLGLDGGALLTLMVAAVGLDEAMSPTMGPTCRPWAIHDPGKILVQLVLSQGVAVVWRDVSRRVWRAG
jgi:hypothetical protein